MKDYRKKFESFADVVELANQRYLQTMFLNGLHEEITAKLSLHSFESLKDMMTMAERVDEWNRLYSGSGAVVVQASRGCPQGVCGAPSSRSFPQTTCNTSTGQEWALMGVDSHLGVALRVFQCKV